MARPNPLEPILINVKSLGVNMPADYTRVFGIVSYGDTNLPTNTLKAISKKNIDELELKTNSYTGKFLNSFFANNPTGLIQVLEVNATPNIKVYKPNVFFADDAKTYKCVKEDTATSETNLKPKNLGSTTYWQDNSGVASFTTGYIYNQGSQTYKCKKSDTAKTVTDLTPQHLTDDTYWTNITNEVVGAGVKVLSDFIKEGKTRVYEWACPTVFYNNSSFIDLVKSFADITAGQYFSVELPSDIEFDTDEFFSQYTKSKSFAPVYPSLNENESANGAIMGIKASKIYDLNASNSLSLLQWKTVNGITPVEISNKLLDDLNENGCSWIGELNRNTVVLGGMVADGKEWNHYFALDTYIYKLLSGISTMMIQGSNNPKVAVRFTQGGIDMLKQKLVSISDYMLSIGVLDEYGADYDTSKNAILNTGEWAMISFADYKANQYQDYKDSIYNGASSYATIGKFILQVIPNITIE